jgi:hypothetical protein
MKDVYAQAAITPLRTNQNEPVRYRVEVDGDRPLEWANTGVYDTPEDALAAFTLPLRIERRLEAVQALRESRKFTFSLSDLSL